MGKGRYPSRLNSNVPAAFALAKWVPPCTLLHVTLFAVRVLGLGVFFCPFWGGGEDPVHVVSFAVFGVVFGHRTDDEESPISLEESI